MNTAFCRVNGGKIYYEQHNTAAQGLPILVIHGGPGMPHTYLKSLVEILPHNPVIFYDQLDCGLSTKTNRSELWDLAPSVLALEALRIHLGLEQFYIYAHSAGSMLGFDYAASYSEYIVGLILASPVLSIKKYYEGLDLLLENMPPPYRLYLQQLKQQQSLDSMIAMEAMAYFSEQHMCQLPIWPEELFDAIINTNKDLRDYLWGSSDLYLSGILNNYERLDKLAQFRTRTLISCGVNDFVHPDICFYYAQEMTQADTKIISKASHHCHLENPEEYRMILNQWLQMM